MSRTTDKVIDQQMEEINSPQPRASIKLQLYKSIAALQQELPVIDKNAKGYGYKYSDLSNIYKALLPLMRKHNLGFIQPLEGAGLTTIIFCTKTGAELVSHSEIPQGVQLKGMNDYQVYGSAVTYFRRYTLCSKLGIVSDEDNDASGKQTNTTFNQFKSAPKLPTIDTKKFAAGVKAIESGKYTKEQMTSSFTLTESQKATLELC